MVLATYKHVTLPGGRCTIGHLHMNDRVLPSPTYFISYYLTRVGINVVGSIYTPYILRDAQSRFNSIDRSIG